MSFLADLRRELARVGIRGRLARRIELELADHLACDPQSSLGAPAEIAERFAAELRVVRTRRSSLFTFGALLLCAALTLVIARRNVSPLGPVGGLALLALCQIAFVAGMLTLLGLRARTPGQLRLAQRRSLVALLAGGGVCVVAIVSTADRLGAAALLPLALLAVAAVRTRAAAALTPPAAMSPDVPAWALVLLGAAAVGVVLAQGIAGEHSLAEGVIRAAIEATGLAAAVAVLGRPLGLRA